MEEVYEKIRKELHWGFDYEKGDDVRYFHFVQACEPHCDVNDVNLEEFEDIYEDIYNVNIG